MHHLQSEVPLKGRPGLWYFSNFWLVVYVSLFKTQFQVSSQSLAILCLVPSHSLYKIPLGTTNQFLFHLTIHKSHRYNKAHQGSSQRWMTRRTPHSEPKLRRDVLSRGRFATGSSSSSNAASFESRLRGAGVGTVADSGRSTSAATGSTCQVAPRCQVWKKSAKHPEGSIL